jgi:hypothetical protein
MMDDVTIGSDGQELETLIESVVHKFMSPGAEHELIASIMVAALFFGPNETALNEFGYDSGTVRVVAARMRDSQTWTDDVVDYQDWYSAMNAGEWLTSM